MIVCLAVLFGGSALPAAASGMDCASGRKYSSENPWINYDKVILTYDENASGRVSRMPLYLCSARAASISSARRMKHLPIEIVTFARGNRMRSAVADRQAVLDSFKGIPGVRTAEYDVMRKILGFAFSQGPRMSDAPGGRADMTAEQWYLDLTGAKEAWSTTRGDPSFVVAVIDTGINLTHPDLAGALWTNPGEIPDNGIDDDGNGYIDDLPPVPELRCTASVSPAGPSIQ